MHYIRTFGIIMIGDKREKGRNWYVSERFTAMEVAVAVEKLGKSYTRDKVVLKDVSFEVLKGETVGIIGRNGVGKSTLLKILAGTIKPTTGRAVMYGSVASILDIGAGFHPELSGYDNIFLAGNLLGFSKKEIEKKLDEIIAFSELEEFIHRPVKIYSSGMFLRLAFSIFILLDTDILLLDEVLSVGDAAFKRKSFNMMDEMKSKGKTIILVTHNFQEIETYCDRVIYLDQEIKYDSTNPREAIMEYLRDYPAESKMVDVEWVSRDTKADPKGEDLTGDKFFDSIGDDLFQLTSLKITSNGLAKRVFSHDEEITVNATFRKKVDEGALLLCWKMFDINDNLLLSDAISFRKEYVYESQPAGNYRMDMVIPAELLNTGMYYLTLMACEGHKKILKGTWHDIIGFEIRQGDWMKDQPWSAIPAPFMPKMKWVIEPLDD